MRFLLATSALALLLLGPAAAQSRNEPPAGIGNPAGTQPGTLQRPSAPHVPHQANQADRVFLTVLDGGGMAEIEFARLAEQKSQNEMVRHFAQKMIHDHSEAGNEVAKLAAANDVHLGDHRALDPDHQQAYDGLARLTGPEFDIEYMRLALQDHQHAVQLLEYEIGSGESADIKAFASQTLPVIFTHLRMSRDVLASVTAQHPQLASAPAPVSGQPTPDTPPPPHAAH